MSTSSRIPTDNAVQNLYVEAYIYLCEKFGLPVWKLPCVPVLFVGAHSLAFIKFCVKRKMQLLNKWRLQLLTIFAPDTTYETP